MYKKDKIQRIIPLTVSYFLATSLHCRHSFRSFTHNDVLAHTVYSWIYRSSQIRDLTLTIHVYKYMYVSPFSSVNFDGSIQSAFI